MDYISLLIEIKSKERFFFTVPKETYNTYIVSFKI
jgi:hypothetical protein